MPFSYLRCVTYQSVFAGPLISAVPIFAMGKSSQPFAAALQALQPHLDAWLTAVALHPDRFLIPSVSFLEFYDSHFPAVHNNGEWPDSVLDKHQGFSPLLYMLNDYIWRIWCDRILTTATKVNRSFLDAYLSLGEQVITPETYLGASIPGRFCSNFAYHFKVANGWPTNSNSTVRFLQEFESDTLYSWTARQHAVVHVDLHQTTGPWLSPLQTREQCSTDRHKQNTPPSILAVASTPKIDAQVLWYYYPAKIKYVSYQ
jgi:hypothetical protein